MDYARVLNGVIQAEMSVPAGSVGPADGTGYYEIIDAVRPADTATATFIRTLELVAGRPTVVWAERAKTQDELHRATAIAKAADLVEAIATLRAWSVTARAATVTSANAVATLAVVVKNLAEFYDGFADLLAITMGNWQPGHDDTSTVA